MLIAFDAKRAFHNKTGLGNYSRDVIRMFSYWFHTHSYLLCDSHGRGIDFDYNSTNTTTVTADGAHFLARKAGGRQA